jgi:DNA-binding NarL/FixJ family response regulator
MTSNHSSPSLSPVGPRSHSERRLPDLIRHEEWQFLMARLRLAPREADVLRRAFYDERTDAIAGWLSLSEGTVKTYRDRLYRKLGVRSMTQVIAAVTSEYLSAVRPDESHALTDGPIMARRTPALDSDRAEPTTSSR